MRGKPTWSDRIGVTARNIPAYAGKTLGGNIHIAGHGEHPRVCGENVINDRRPVVGSGTSPRMRGKPPQALCRSIPGRNIPAYAGKTCRKFETALLASEHPRVCGENSLTPFLASLSFGTSPRMRGKQRYKNQWPDTKRNIPAYAGKTQRL